MQIDPTANRHATNYKLITNLVVPRPIAWVSSISAGGLVNLAPFSFFNAVSSDPLYIFVSIGRRDDGSPKDTASNIAATGDFVVNLVTEDLLEAMNLSATDFPPDISEVPAAKLSTLPSTRIQAPRIAQAHASLECKLHSTQPLGAYTLHIAQVLMFHIQDDLVGEKMHIEDFAPIGRLGSPAVYCRTTERFDLPRIPYGEWQKTHLK